MPKNSIIKWLLGLIIASLSSAVGMGYDQGASIEPKDEEDDEEKGSSAGHLTALRENCREGESPYERVSVSKECGGGVEDLLSDGNACCGLGFGVGRCKSEQYLDDDSLGPSCGDGMGGYGVCREAVGGEAYTAEEGLAMDLGCYHNDLNAGSLWCFSLYVNGNQVDCDAPVEACA